MSVVITQSHFSVRKSLLKCKLWEGCQIYLTKRLYYKYLGNTGKTHIYILW